MIMSDTATCNLAQDVLDLAQGILGRYATCVNFTISSYILPCIAG